MSTKTGQYRLFMLVSGGVYFFVGLMFLLIPASILSVVNYCANLIFPNLTPMPESPSAFWPILSFSMMMTIAAAAVGASAQSAPSPFPAGFVMTAKLASSAGALLYMIMAQTNYTGYVTIFIVDGSLFLMTVYMYLRANRSEAGKDA